MEALSDKKIGKIEIDTISGSLLQDIITAAVKFAETQEPWDLLEILDMEGLAKLI